MSTQPTAPPPPKSRIPPGRVFSSLSSPMQARIAARQGKRGSRFEAESCLTSTELNRLRNQKRKAAANRAMPQLSPALPSLPQTLYETAKLELQRSTPTSDEALYRLHGLRLNQEQHNAVETRMKKEDKAHKRWLFALIDKPNEQDPTYPQMWRTIHARRSALGVLRGDETGQISIVPAVLHLVQFTFEAAGEPSNDPSNDDTVGSPSPPPSVNDDTAKSLSKKRRLRRGAPARTARPIRSDSRPSAISTPRGGWSQNTRTERAAMRMRASWEKAGYFV